jgi:uncharacterized protein (TIGR04551 family)
MIRLQRAALAVAAVVVPLTVRAQTPGGTLGPPPGGTISEEESKDKGPVERAPREESKLPTLPPLPPYPGQERKKFELIELNGYMRLRADWMDNFHLGFNDTGNGAPFRRSLTCSPSTPSDVTDGVCSGSIGSSNLRVRLEPTINLSEHVALHLQIDALDNLVLGSTPRRVYPVAPDAPTGGLGTGQTAPEGGKGSPWDSVRVKQAWADVKTPLGALRFGRMPSQWGLGILSNAGGYDWIHDTTCLDCDYGDTVDRFIFGTTIPGTSLRAAIGYDWVATGPTFGQLDAWSRRDDGQPIDGDDADDATQYVLMLSRIDDPDIWQATVRDGRTAVNLGLQFFYRRQKLEARADLDPADPAAAYLTRNLTAYIPDLWLRFTTGRLVFEGEIAGVFGTIDNLVDPTAASMSLAQIGAVGRLQYYLLDGSLELMLEVGFASGDDWEDERSGTIHIDDANYLPRDAADTTLSRFLFSRDYHIDLILFRELYGAVTNALYFRPAIRYNLSDRFSFRGQGVMSFAHRSVATPGNEGLYGIELDADVGYSNEKEGFFAGLSYGVLFPLAALDHPAALFPNDPTNGASTAQTFQARFILKF